MGDFIAVVAEVNDETPHYCPILAVAPLLINNVD